MSKNADANEIKKAYRKAAIKNHPDKGGDPEKVRENDNLIAPARDRVIRPAALFRVVFNPKTRSERIR